MTPFTYIQPASQPSLGSSLKADFDVPPSTTHDSALDPAKEPSLCVLTRTSHSSNESESEGNLHTILQKVVGYRSGKALRNRFWVDWDLPTLYAADDGLISLQEEKTVVLCLWARIFAETPLPVVLLRPDQVDHKGTRKTFSISSVASVSCTLHPQLQFYNIICAVQQRECIALSYPALQNVVRRSQLLQPVWCTVVLC